MTRRLVNTPDISDPDVQADGSCALQETAIAALAYALWQGRGYPSGSDQEDWFRAEQELKGRSAQPSKAA
jgi:hypothetical protein